MKKIIQLLVSHNISIFHSWFVIGFSYIPDSSYCRGKTGSQYWLSLGIIQFEYSLGGLTIKIFGNKKPFLSYLQVDFNEGTWVLYKKESNSGNSHSGTPKPLPFTSN